MSEADKAARAAELDAAIRTTDCPACGAASGARCVNTYTGFAMGGLIHGSRVASWEDAGKPQ